MDKQIAHVYVLVKAYPQPGQQYEETICCAAITDSEHSVHPRTWTA